VTHVADFGSFDLKVPEVEYILIIGHCRRKNHLKKDVDYASLRVSR
jgi:hypothetical protein